MKIYLTISFVSSSHTLTSSALIPLLSADLPFFEFVDCSSQLFCRDLWDSRHLISVVVMHTDAALIFTLSGFWFRLFLFIVDVYFFVEFAQDIGNPFSDVMISPLSFFILVMSTLLFADLNLIPGMFLIPLKSSSIR